MFKRLIQVVAVVALTGFLSACESVEDRVEKHFERGVELYDAGDSARAIVELRNIFRLDDDHLEARMLMARIEEDRENFIGAYKQYLNVTENHPDYLPGQQAAARLAGDLGDWDAAERHVVAAKELLGETEPSPVLRSVELGTEYRRARINQDLERAFAIAERAGDLLQYEPDLTLLRRLRIDDHLFRQNWDAALAELDTMVERNPDERPLYEVRFAVLRQLGRADAIEAQMLEMIDRFPDDDSLPDMLLAWYVSQQRVDDAEAYLRDRIGQDGQSADARLTLIDFLNQLRGPQATLAEIETILADTADDDISRPLYRVVRASLIFDMGDREAGIAEVKTVLDGLAEEAPADQRQQIRLTLARMLEQNSSPAAAKALVEEVLKEDAANVEALKMRAVRLVKADRPHEALVDLRLALDQTPRAPDLFTLMAQAHERAGNHNLTGEMLAMAVEVSDSAPQETLRYATYLVQDDRLLEAASALMDTLRVRADHVQVLGMLGDIYIDLEDWPRAQGIIDALESNGSASHSERADSLTVRLLAAQNRQQELQTLLEQLASVPEGNNQALVAAIRLRLTEGDAQGAQELLATSLAKSPQDPELRFVSAGLLALDGKQDEAADILRELLQELPQNDRLWLSLYTLYRNSGAPDKANAVLEEALQAVPDSVTLNWTLASRLEQEGDIAGAIAIYERLYAQDSNLIVIANNLASLLSSFEEGDDNLQRAHAIAQRLRGTDVPQFQDTFGWITARIGNYEEALTYLEPAAAALPQEPAVHYHLAWTYARLGQTEQALETYRKVLELIDASDRPVTFRDEVVAAIARLEAVDGAGED